MGFVLRVSIKPATAGEPGLPKGAVESAVVGVQGLAGDFNRYRQDSNRGDPDSAVLLVCSETLAGLRDDGWPVQPGDLGENLTLTGVPPDLLGPGRILRIAGVSLQVSRACEPCTNLYALPYVGESQGPAFLKATLGRRGWYARVLSPGVLRTGAEVELATAAT
jgi:MOSC domain-containing protein YiiM